MPKTKVATEEPEDKKVCPTHNTPLKYSRKLKEWYCPDCLYASHLTHRAQQEAVKRYRQSEKGKEAERRYELSEKGRKARERYLKSEKYKQRRREYNQRLRESLRIARLARAEKATREKEVEVRRTEELSPLVQDIREYIDIMGKLPHPLEVVAWAKESYKIKLSTERASELINRAKQRT